MNNQKLELFIIENNVSIINSLRTFLEKRFGTVLNITVFDNAENAVEKINTNTAIVIVDNDLKGEKADNLIKQIKLINPKTEVIILSSNEDVADAVDALRKGAADYVVIGDGATYKIASKVYEIITYPANFVTRLLGVNSMLAVFLLSILFIAIVVYLGMTYLPNVNY